MTATLERYTCWQPERIGQVISRLAMTVDSATFLATHVPMREITDKKRNGITDENAFLAELQSQGEHDRHVFAVVQGMPGAGKSHLIRWLKEQYVLAHPGDGVLLIERENNSLRATIQQIIDAELIDKAQLPEHLKRLQGAVDLLQPEILAERLINSLQEAVRSSDWESINEHLGDAPSRLSPTKIEYFLLDKNVRNELQSAAGPITRLTQFLALGTGDGVGMELAPGFEADDLVLSRELRTSIRNQGGYREVINLCDDLADSRRGEEQRIWLARYFTYLLHISAVGNATQLAAGDLRALLHDLRDAMHQAGKHLALFIEDITSFTGLDTGLIEALDDEHVSEGKVNTCRLLSVVGITDGYYDDKFPDNIKDRVTHRIALNDDRDSGERREADMMREPKNRAELAARYLNAIRLPAARLTEWFNRGAQPDALPNACAACPVRDSCHAAFGAVSLNGNETSSEVGKDDAIGLYPFNRTALDTLYTLLRNDRSRTQRTFLADIVAHVLQAHGDLISAGNFPPIATELAAAVNPPGLSTPAHERIIEDQGGDFAARLRTLILFWGARNVFQSVGEKGTTIVGGLPKEVFVAFGLPTIDGVPAPTPITSTTTTKESVASTTPSGPEQQGSRNTNDASRTKQDNRSGTSTTTSSTEPPRSRFSKLIDAWSNGGPLHGYEDLVDLLVDTVKGAIDWQAHNISKTQVEFYLKRRFFVIEGQSGSVVSGRRFITLPRNPEVRDLLHAISDFYTSTVPLTQDSIGEQLATISAWLRLHEAEIVAFVGNPETLPVTSEDFGRLFIESAAFLACLEGRLTPESAADPRLLYKEIMATCLSSSDTSWSKTTGRLEVENYPSDWLRLMKNVDRNGAVHVCRQEVLNLLNRPQGISSSTLYFDTARAIRHLQALIEREWRPLPLTYEGGANDPVWDRALHVHRGLSQSFASVISAANTLLHKNAAALSDFFGDANASEVFAAIKSAVDDLRQVRALPQKLEQRAPTMQPQAIDQMRAAVSLHLKETRLPAIAPSLGTHFGEWHNTCVDLNLYFDALRNFMQSTTADLDKQMQDGGQSTEAESVFQSVQQKYDVIVDNLNEGFALNLAND